MRKSRLLAAAAVTAALSLPGGMATASAATNATHPIMQNGYTESQVKSADPATAAYWFNTSTALAQGSPPTLPYSATQACYRETSYAQFQTDLSNGTVTSAKYNCVLYDDEEWSQTPTNEQYNPEKYLPLFNQAATSHGLTPYASPANDLGNVATSANGSPCVKTSGETNVAWYENCHIAKYAAEDGGSVDVQTQSSTTDQAAFTTLYDDAKADALGANPSAIVFAECSSTYGTALECTNNLQHIGRSQILGIYMQDTNSDAATPGGWEDTVLSTLLNKGW